MVLLVPPPAPGARLLTGRLRTRVTSAAALVAAVTFVVAAASGCSATPRDQYKAAHYTPKLPSYLAHHQGSTDAELTGTPAKPALTVEGLPVKVVTPGWTVTISVAGPTVPASGLAYNPPATTCTWTVTLSAATAEVPLSIADFNSIDHLGKLYRPGVAAGTAAPPVAVSPGQTVTFELQAYEAIGEGLIRWAPDGRHIAAEWDYEVETD